MAAVVRSVEQLARQARGHRRLAAVARGGYQPADRERLRAVGADFDGNLIGRTADAAAAHFDVRTDVGERFVEHADRFLLGAGLDRFESAIRSEEHTSELQSLMRNSYAVLYLKTKNQKHQ